AWTWNATVERELGYGTTVEIGYVGRRGLNQQRERNINQLLPGTLQANPGINADFLRPYKGYGFIRTTNNESTSRYNGLQIEVSRRMSKGLSFGFAYTLSKLYDSGSAQRDIIPNAYDAHNLWAPSDYDRRHVAVVNFVWQLPIFRNQSTLLGKIAGGWQLSTIAQFQTGTPFSVAKGDDYAGVGPGSGSQFWDITGDPHLADANWSPGGTADSNFYFNKSAFKQPAPGTFVTNTVRNTLYNPGFQNWTAALFKKFTITENQSVQFRSEFYNFPNHPNWSNPTNDPTSSAFGKITAKNFERSLQLSLRYSF
ncbi:MAG TPA: hypothetical protein VMZ52_12680, partial [Bryobacteraceae bacterium]|nr:hypothetical protein [Bryobacteraceae bacterium]